MIERKNQGMLAKSVTKPAGTDILLNPGPGK
jgi:hypothetical protein